jgi:hypothetical protein
MPAKETRPHKVEEKILADGSKIPCLEGRAPCSQRAPLREAQDWFVREHSRWARTSLAGKPIVVLGAGAGFHLAEIWRCEEVVGKIYVIELEAALFYWNQRQQSFPEQVTWINQAELADFLKTMDSIYPLVAEFRPGWLDRHEEYLAISRRLLGEKNIKQVLLEDFSQMTEQEQLLWQALGEMIR